MGWVLIVEFPRGWCGGSGLRVLQRVRFGAVRDQNRTGIMDFQMLSNPGSQENRKMLHLVRGMRIEQAIAAERKSPACEDGREIPRRPSGMTTPQKEQGRPAQYNANGLASPGH